MAILLPKLLPLGLFLLCTGLLELRVVGAEDRDRPRTADRDEAKARSEAPTVALGLGKVRDDALPWLGRRVRFVVQFEDRLPDWDPFLTRFGPGDWAAFSAWPDERFTWEPEVFHDPFSRLFVRRGGDLEEALATAERYDRFAAVGVVREIFLGEPWLEIEVLEPLAERVGEGTILHVGRARDFMQERKWRLALEQFQRAGAAPLPAHARAELQRQIIECARRREAAEDDEL